MSLSDLPEINTAIDSALNAAHLHFQGLLRTSFSPTSGLTDTFYLRENEFPENINGFLRLRLSRGFIDPTSLQLTSGDTLSTIAAVVGATEYGVDADKGILYLDDSYESKYVQVVYDCGFAGNVKPPDWLKEAILSFVPSVLNSQQTTNRADEAEATSSQARNLTEVTIEPYLRRVPFCYKPLFPNA